MAVLTAVTYWPQIAHPALYRDDWQLAWAQLENANDFLGYAFHSAITHNRPVYVLVDHLLNALFGHDAAPLLLSGLLVDALVCTAAFALLSVIGIKRRPAAVLAALVMVYPLADSTRLMTSMATTTLGAGFYLVGATLAIRALARSAPGPRHRLHALAIGCYLLSLLSYESAAGFIVLSFLVYRLVAPWRAAVRHWLIDVAGLGIPFGAFLIANRIFGSHVSSVVSLTELPHRAAVFAYESVGAIALSIFPAGPALVTRLVVVERVAALLVLLILLGAGYEAIRRRGGAEELVARIHGALCAVAFAPVAVLLAYAPFLIAVGDYHPLERGQGNRVNQLAALPLLVLAYGLLNVAWAMIDALIRPLTARMRLTRGRFYALIPAAALMLASAITVRGDITRWQSTAHSQGRLQRVVTTALAAERRPFAVVVFGPLDLFSPAIPHDASGVSLTLLGTFSVPLGRLLGPEYLVAPGARFRCGASSMFPIGFPREAYGYGQTLLLKPPWTHPVVVADQRACLVQTDGRRDKPAA